ncbi:MAG: LrgB family protein [Erysipelothrix sp.]
MLNLIVSNPLFGIILTLGVYFAAQKLQEKTNFALLNPLLVSSIFIIILLSVTNVDYDSFNKGGSFLTMLIGPATVALAIPLYKNLDLLKKHYLVILVSILSGVIAHAILIGIFTFILNLSPELIATMIPKSVTTAIAIDISNQLGGITTLTISVVIVTGILGAALAPILNKFFKINNPIAQGLALGTSAHAVGTSKAVEMGEMEGTMSSLALIITGITTVLLAPITQSIIHSLYF